MADRDPEPQPGSLAWRWDQSYRHGRPPWDIGLPQPVFVRLADAGEMSAPALDCGCGTGEHALMLAARGIEAVGVDIAPTAIARARQKAAERGLTVDFAVGNVLDLRSLGRTFATVIDSGVFHTMSDEDRPRYVASLARVVRPGGVLHLMCFSDREPDGYGPRRVSQAELRAAFAQDWTVERIEAATFEVRDDSPTPPARAWLARIVRAGNR